jgi:hypothetical protein
MSTSLNSATLHTRANRSLNPIPHEAVFIDDADAASLSFSFIEGWIDLQNELNFRPGSIHLKDLDQFINGNWEPIHAQNKGHARFRVLSCPRIEVGFLRGKVELPEMPFEQIRNSWQPHGRTLQTFLHNPGHVQGCTTVSNDCILIKVAQSRLVGFDAASVAYNPSKQLTSVLYYGLEDENGIFERLLKDRDRCLQPGSFAAVLYCHHQERIEGFREMVDNELVAIEAASKFGWVGRLLVFRYKNEQAI